MALELEIRKDFLSSSWFQLNTGWKLGALAAPPERPRGRVGPSVGSGARPRASGPCADAGHHLVVNTGSRRGLQHPDGLRQRTRAGTATINLCDAIFGQSEE